MAKSWYVFMGYGDPLDAESYAKIQVIHACLCGNEICAMYANGEGFRPDAPFSSNIHSYIEKALATKALQPALPAGSKKYVYLRYK